jgi:hypothetical protein
MNNSCRERGLILYEFKKNGIVRYFKEGGYYCFKCQRFMHEGESIRKHISFVKVHRDYFRNLKEKLQENNVEGI